MVGDTIMQSLVPWPSVGLGFVQSLCAVTKYTSQIRAALCAASEAKWPKS